MKIALCVISKDNESSIKRMLDSTKGVFDLYCLQDTGSTDKTVSVWEDWCIENDKEYIVSEKKLKKDYEYVTVNNTRILGNFGKARSDSFNLARNAGMDYAFWFDTDDILVNPQGIKPLALKLGEKRYHAAILTYIYAKAEGNLKPVVQKRERLIDLSVDGDWKNRVHENYEFNIPARLTTTADVWIEHERTEKGVLDTGRRNHLIMKAQEKDDGLKSFTDALLNSYAYDHWEHKEYPLAIKYYKKLLKRKNYTAKNKDLQYQVFLKLARAYLGLNDVENAIVYAIKCISINKGLGDGYLILAEANGTVGNWEDAIYYADKVLKIGKPDTPNPINEMEYTVIPMRIKVQALLATNKMEEALAVENEILRLFPNDNIRQEKATIEYDLSVKQAIIGINSIVRYMQDNNQMKYADRLREAIPYDLLDHNIVRNIITEMMHDYRRKTSNIKLKGKKSIVIYAGDGVTEPWDGESDITKGIGGSEGMTIQLSRELAKLDNKVIIYNNCGTSSGKEFDGVLYENFDKWNSDMKSDVFISLRRPDIFSKIIRSSKQYLWLHDTGYGELPKSFFYSPNKVIVLSQAHKQVIKKNHGIKDDSIFFISRNGVNPIALEYAEKNRVNRNPWQIMYASSYDRGLDNLLEMWPKIKKAVPEAKLNIFYGWNTFDSLMNARAGTQQGQWMQDHKSKMIEMISKAEDVKELGRVSQNELYKEFAESGLWFYPTEFYEISCINAMTAQALGCVPVVTPYAALNETVQHGFKYKIENIADGIIHLLKNQEMIEKKRKPMIKWAKKEYSMKSLAKLWNKEFNNG